MVQGAAFEEAIRSARLTSEAAHGRGEGMDILELKEEVLGVIDRLDSLVVMMNNRLLSDELHMTCLRQSIPEIAVELREHIETL